jgi:transposase
MLRLPAGIKVWVSIAPVDMRKSFDGLAAVVQTQWQQDVMSGQLFVFLGKRKDRIKVLYWDENGFALWYKRLENGVYRLPRVDKKVVKMSMSELSLLLEGIDLTDRRRLKAV